MRKMLTAFIICIISIVISGCNNSKVDELNRKIQQQETRIENLTKEIKEEKTAQLLNITQTLSQSLALHTWQYDLETIKDLLQFTVDITPEIITITYTIEPEKTAITVKNKANTTPSTSLELSEAVKYNGKVLGNLHITGNVE